MTANRQEVTLNDYLRDIGEPEMSTEHSPTPWRLKIIDGEFVLVDAENFGVELDEETYLRVVTAVNSHAALVSQRDTYRQALENIKEQIPEERSNRRRLPIIAIIIGIIDAALEAAEGEK